MKEQNHKLKKSFCKTLNEFHSALELLKDISIADAAKLYVQTYGLDVVDIPLQEAMEKVRSLMFNEETGSKQINSVTASVKRLIKVSGNKTLLQMQPDDVRKMIQSPDLNPRSKSNLVKNLTTFYNKCVGGGIYPKQKAIPTEGIKLPNMTRRKPITFTPIGDVPKIIAVSADNPFVFAFACIGYFTGIRVDEIARLEWRDFQWERQRIFLPANKTKTKRDRYVPLSENLLRLLEPYRECRGPVNIYYNPSTPLIKLLHKHQLRMGGNDLRHSYATYSRAHRGSDQSTPGPSA